MIDKDLLKAAAMVGATAVLGFIANELRSTEKKPKPLALAHSKPLPQRRKKRGGGRFTHTGKPATGMFKTREELESRVKDLWPKEGKVSRVARAVGASPYVVKKIVNDNGLAAQTA